jgi:hypothetical protein
VEVIAAAETWLDGTLADFFLSVLKKLEQRAKRCIELRGEYVEQIPRLVAVAFFLTGRTKDLSALPRISKHPLHIKIFLDELDRSSSRVIYDQSFLTFWYIFPLD